VRDCVLSARPLRAYSRRGDGWGQRRHPVPLGFFSFTGWKQSFFGDLHSHGKDGALFFTEKKSVSYRWFEESDAKVRKVGTWD
jgi:hypothetical protein